MKRSLFKGMLCAGIMGAVLGGCQTEDLYNPEKTIQQYEDAWENTFGRIDPQQTWNLAKQVTADVNLPYDECNVQIYTSNPVNEDSRIVAETSINQKGFITFDIQQDADYVFVIAKNEKNILLNSYIPIEGNKMFINNSAKVITKAEDCPVTIGNPYEIKGSYWDPSYTNPDDEYDHSRPVAFTVAYLNGVTTTEGDSWKVKEWLNIVGKGAPFEEYTDNLTKWKEQLGTKVEYVTSKEGPVELSLNFGATINRYAFGYFYYKDGEDPNKAVRYVLFDQYNPVDFIKKDGQPLSNDMELAQISAGYISGETVIQGSKVKLVYNDNGIPTYTFPKGIHIAFFVNKSNQHIINPDNLWSSIHSKDYYNPSLKKDDIHTCAVNYRYGEQIILGIEDGEDWDMNDLLFFVNGTFEDEPENIGPDISDEDKPEPQSWILACEDLGAIDDFDFNDVVFSVSHVEGSNQVTVTPLAAGGILEAEIMYNGQSYGEIHSLLGASATTFVNTENGITHTATPITINVDENFSITQNMGGFSVKVIDEEGNANTEITAPGQGEAPQMICVPGTWQWPIERISVSVAYPDFGEWGANYGTNNDWCNNPVDGKVIRR